MRSRDLSHLFDMMNLILVTTDLACAKDGLTTEAILAQACLAILRSQ